MIILLGLLIFVHELGHFLVAKYFKVRVEVFSLGFGKKLLSFRRGETEYCIAAVPLGGYVKMFGDDPSAEVSEADRAGSFLHKPVGQRIAVVLAGPIMNLLFAFLLYSAIAMIGERALFPGLGDLAQNSTAWSAGFRSGDTILEIDGKSIATWNELEKIIQSNPGKPLRFGIQREDGTATSLEATPKLIANPNVLSWTKEIGDIDGLTFLSRSATIAVIPGSAAATAGMRSGDSIIKINATQFRRWREIERAVGSFASETKLTFTVQRGFIEALQKADEEAQPQTLEFVVDVPAAAAGQSGTAALRALGFDDPELYLASIEKDSPAEKAGLRPGDQLVSINGEKLTKFEEVVGRIRAFDGTKPIDFAIIRDGKPMTLAISPNVKKRMNHMGQEETRFEVGIRPMIIDDVPQTVQVATGNVIEAVERGAVRSVEMSGAIVVGLVRLFQGQVSSKNVGGFLSIGQMAKKSWSAGASEYLMAMAVISLNLFVLNLLPVPVLDGGHLVFYTIEAVRGAPLSMQKMELAQRVGAALLVGLMVFALFNDVSRIFFR
ncbi:MAG: RIP metalloprotease RseP [Bdellovibrionales bacterium]|nr:RIP metalloprotease RseP [Bdellovibrionales bacterium]